MYRTLKIRCLIALLLCLLGAQRLWAETAEEQYQLAAGYYSQQRWPEAVAAFQELVANHPDDERSDAARFYLGEAMIQTGQYGSAHKMFNEFRERLPDHEFAPQALFRAGETAYLDGQTETARRTLRSFHETYPKNPICEYALPYLGELSLTSGKASEAENYYQTALSQYPQSPLANACRFGLGRALEKQGKNDGAEEQYSYLIEKQNPRFVDDALLQLAILNHHRDRHAEAIAGLQALNRAYPNSPLRARALYWLGMAQSATADWKSAAETLALAVEINDDQKLAPAAHFALGEALRKTDQPAAAEEHYHQIVQRWPGSPWGDDSLDVLIQMAFDAGDYPKIDTFITVFEEKFSDSPLRLPIETVYARSLLKRREFPQAIALLESLAEATEDTSGDADENSKAKIAYLLGLAHLGQEKYELALRSLDQIKIPADAKDKAIAEMAAGAEMARASALFKLARYNEAIPAQQKYLRLRPDGPDADKCRAELAVSLAHGERFDESLAQLQELSERGAGPAILLPTIYFLAESAYASERREMAERLFGELAKEGNPPEYIEKGLYGLAWIQAEVGQREKSAETFQTLLARFPNSSHAAEAAYMRARSLEQAGQLLPALSTYRTVVDNFPNSKHVVDSLLAAARLYSRYDDAEHRQESIRLFNRFVNEYPDHEQMDAALYELAWVYCDAQQPDEADNIFLRLHDQFRTSKYWGDVTYRLAEKAARSRDNAQAEKLTEEIIAAKVDGEILSHALYLGGQLAADRGDWAAVGQYMAQIVIRFPASTLHFPASYWVAEASYRQQQWEQAHAQFSELARRSKEQNEGWMAMIPLRQAQLLARQEEWTEAYTAAIAAVRQFPKFHQLYELHYIIGRALASKGKFEDARQAYTKVVQSPTGGATEIAAMAQWMIGETHFHQRNYDEAIKAYHRVETLYDAPRWQAASLLQAGKCYERKTDWESAIKLYAELLRKHSNSRFREEASQRLRVAQQRLGEKRG